ncbi:putative transmembrane protein [Cinnamomum micranthum f. kanehirae]|uniref:Putative transmembrane protein n=1 Tax=Cinnamomum micranthum f. kanehirae TaxID=337451 RepID=A0A443N7J4_9MAGN|nr:putative transmembrane protein [Cinnamomum micranthum f. kanehirae]
MIASYLLLYSAMPPSISGLASAGAYLERERERERDMADWGPVVIAVILFVLLSPGLLFQLPGRNRIVEFGNFQTSGVSILVHTIIFFGLITIFLIAIGVHIYTG